MQTLPADTTKPTGDEWNATLVTRGGVTMAVRAVRATDGPILAELFDHVSPADLRFRFLSGLRHVDDARIRQMIDVDCRTSMTFLAFEGTSPIATAMLAAGPDPTTAEVAISVRSDRKGSGIGWTLLQLVMRFAKANGITRVNSTESRDNSVTLDLERDAGFEIRQCQGDPADVLAIKTLTRT